MLFDVGPKCTISRYFVCRRHLPPAEVSPGLYTNDISPDISRISHQTLLLPLGFIRLELIDCLGKHSAKRYELENFGPGLLVFEYKDTDQLQTPHGRWVGDSRDFSSTITVHATFRPTLPLEWADCEVTEEDDGERNIIQRILREFRHSEQSNGGRRSPLIRAETVLRNMYANSAFT